MPFQNTRQKYLPLASLVSSAGNPMTWLIPKTGILGGIFLDISCTITGAPVTPDARGVPLTVRRIRLTANSGIDLINISGVGYHFLFRDFIEAYQDPSIGTGARVALSAATFNVGMYLPLQINQRDPIGLFMLQNEQTQLVLTVEAEAPANLAASGITANVLTVVPTLVNYSVPLKKEDWPDFAWVCTLIEEQQVISATSGDITYYWPRGNTFLQVLHGYGIKTTGPADNASLLRVRVNQSDYWYATRPRDLDRIFEKEHGRARLAGQYPVDLLGSSGLGAYGSLRDAFDSSQVTDIASVLSITAADTLYTVRRELVRLA